jgi:excisionase family DNA binding protein
MIHPPSAPDAPLSYPIRDLARVAGIGRNKAYALIAEGKLRAVKSGNRTLVLGDSLRAYLANLPPVVPARRA